MKKTNHRSVAGLIPILLVGLILLGCGGGGSSNSSKDLDDPAEPSFAASSFSQPTEVDNLYRPMVPGTVDLYQAETEDGLEITVVEVLEATREVNGVTCRVVRDRVFLE